MIQYYLTEMNLLRLENNILKFTYKHNIQDKLTNGIISKITSMMYEKQIDYYYPDHIATTLQVDIKHVNQIYQQGYNKLYQKPLSTLLSQCELYHGEPEASDKLEQQVNKILTTRKPILTRKVQQKKWRKQK